jgi:hypothetical protein
MLYLFLWIEKKKNGRTADFIKSLSTIAKATGR